MSAENSNVFKKDEKTSYKENVTIEYQYPLITQNEQGLTLLVKFSKVLVFLFRFKRNIKLKC